MKHGTFDALRAALFLLLIALGVTFCATDNSTVPSSEADLPPESTVTSSPVEYPSSQNEPTEEKIEPETEPVVESREAPDEEEPKEDPWKSLGTFTLTAYCPCEKCCGYWATIRPHDENGNPIVYTSIGAVAKAGTTIAVDPTVIPYGSKVKINGHVYTAEDTGGGIVSRRIDVYFDDHQAALEFGRQQAEVFVKIEE